MNAFAEHVVAMMVPGVPLAVVLALVAGLAYMAPA